VVSGHGGPDPGAIGKMGEHRLHEDEYAYDIALRLARGLMMKGAKTYIIIQDAMDGIRDERILKNSKRETCMKAAIPKGQIERLRQRSAKINALNKTDGKGYARGIFIHIDSRSKRKQTDVFFYHSPQSASKRLAYTMKAAFAGNYKRHQPGRGFTGTVSERSLYVLNNTIPASVFVELGNIQNSFDQQRFVIDNNRQALANWMCEAFVADYIRYRQKRK
jgi:N-acetylmuramoyl-L-alanine amidase